MPAFLRPTTAARGRSACRPTTKRPPSWSNSSTCATRPTPRHRLVDAHALRHSHARDGRVPRRHGAVERRARGRTHRAAGRASTTACASAVSPTPSGSSSTWIRGSAPAGTSTAPARVGRRRRAARRHVANRNRHRVDGEIPPWINSANRSSSHAMPKEVADVAPVTGNHDARDPARLFRSERNTRRATPRPTRCLRFRGVPRAAVAHVVRPTRRPSACRYGPAPNS